MYSAYILRIVKHFLRAQAFLVCTVISKVSSLKTKCNVRNTSNLWQLALSSKVYGLHIFVLQPFNYLYLFSTFLYQLKQSWE